MANKRIDELTAATGAANTDICFIGNPSTGLLKKITVGLLAPQNTELSLVDGATITWDYSLGNIANVTLGGDRILAISNIPDRSFGVLKVTQDGTGSRDLELPTDSLIPGTFALSTAGGSIDMLAFYFDGANYYWSIDNAYVPAIAYDADAQAFFDAVEGGGDTLTLTIKGAVNQLVLDFKAASIWTKFVAIYPVVGGTASAHKWNLKDPQNTDAAHRITYAGTVTHSSSGMRGNAVDGIANTHVIPSSHLSSNNTHVSIYTNDDTSTASGRHGCNSDSGANNILYIATLSNTTTYARMYGTSDDGQITAANSDKSIFSVLSRRSSSDYELYRDGVSVGTNSGSTGVAALPTADFYLFAENSAGTPANFANDRVAFASLGTGLNDTEVAALQSSVQTFNTTLSRNN